MVKGENLIIDYLLKWDFFFKWENIMRYISHRCVLSQEDGNVWERGLTFFSLCISLYCLTCYNVHYCFLNLNIL